MAKKLPIVPKGSFMLCKDHPDKTRNLLLISPEEFETSPLECLQCAAEFMIDNGIQFTLPLLTLGIKNHFMEYQASTDKNKLN